MISAYAADGILHTENAIWKEKVAGTFYPKKIEAEYIRAAHLYNITFSAVRENFAIAGLLPVIDVMYKISNRFPIGQESYY